MIGITDSLYSEGPGSSMQVHCGRVTASLASVDSKPDSSLRFASELRLDELDKADSILIQTVNNTYTFLVLDPAHRSGILMGEAIEGHLVKAILIGSRGDASRLRRGSQALFSIKSDKGTGRLITSEITNLVQAKNGRKTVDIF